MSEAGLAGLFSGVERGFTRGMQLMQQRRQQEAVTRFRQQQLMERKRAARVREGQGMARLRLLRERNEAQKKANAQEFARKNRQEGLTRLNSFTQPFDKDGKPNPVFKLKKDNPEVWKSLVTAGVGSTLHPALDATNPQHKKVLDIITKAYMSEGPIAKAMGKFLSTITDLDPKEQKLIMQSALRNPDKIPELMKNLKAEMQQREDRALVSRVAQLEPLPGQGAVGNVRDQRNILLRRGITDKDILAQFDPQNQATLQKTQAETAGLSDKVYSVFEERDGEQVFVGSILADQRREMVQDAIRRKKKIQIFPASKIAESGQAIRPVTKTQAGKLHGERVKAIGTINTALRLKSRLNKLGRGAIGLRGKLGETLGGLAGQISKGLGQLVTKKITGTSDAGAITAFRVDSQRALGQLMPTFTGEPSRFTQVENNLVRQRTRLLEGGASFEQIQGAMDSIVMGAFLSHDRNAVEAGGRPSYDLIDAKGASIDDNIRRAHTEIKRSTGLDNKEITEILTEMSRQQLLFRQHGLIK